MLIEGVLWAHTDLEERIKVVHFRARPLVTQRRAASSLDNVVMCIYYYDVLYCSGSQFSARLRLITLSVVGSTGSKLLSGRDRSLPVRVDQFRAATGRASLL
jgi:hypothetical protein